MVIPVSRVPHDMLLKPNMKSEEQHIVAKEAIENVRKIQSNRYSDSIKNNGNMTNRDIKKYSSLTDEGRALLETASKKLDLSARRYFKTIKVARTIAELDHSEQITTVHISEALQYR